MKNWYFLALIVLTGISACSEKKRAAPQVGELQQAVAYDTTAIDSFSAGAISVDVAQRIRMSSAAYRDSVKKVMLILEEEHKKKEEQLKLEKVAKAELEKETEKKKEKEKQGNLSPSSEPANPH